MSDLENFDKKRKKAKLKAEISGYVARWRHYRFAPVDAVERACIWLAEEVFTAVDQERRLEKPPKDLSTLKTICINGKVSELPYVKTFHNTTDDGSFQFI